MSNRELDTTNLDYYRSLLVGHGNLPNDVNGVSADGRAIDIVASTDPDHLLSDLVLSQRISDDTVQADADRSSVGFKRAVLEGLADEISEGFTRHPDGTPMTAEEFSAERARGEEVADLIRARLPDEIEKDTAEALINSASTLAYEKAPYTANEAIRAYNVIKVLGRRAVRTTVAVSTVAGTGVGAAVTEAVTHNQNARVLTAITAVGTLSGAVIGAKFRGLVERRAAHRRAVRLQKSS